MKCTIRHLALCTHLFEHWFLLGEGEPTYYHHLLNVTPSRTHCVHFPSEMYPVGTYEGGIEKVIRHTRFILICYCANLSSSLNQTLQCLTLKESHHFNVIHVDTQSLLFISISLSSNPIGVHFSSFLVWEPTSEELRPFYDSPSVL